MADDPHAQPESERLQLERARLECEKLRAEIAQTSLAWWKRPANLASMATLAALLTGWVSGYFPSEREKLQSQIRDLQERMSASRQDALLVNSDLDRLRAEREELKAKAAQNLKALVEKAEATQRRIDEFYLRLKVASANAPTRSRTSGRSASRPRTCAPGSPARRPGCRRTWPGR
jgi:hypothetical protein